MGILIKIASYFLTLAAVVTLVLASKGSDGSNTGNHGVETARDSLVTEVVTTGALEKIDRLMVLKYYERELYMMCIEDFESDKSFILFFKTEGQKPTLLLILKVESCKIENEKKIGQSIIINSCDRDLTNVEVMVRIKNKGCERYTSVDRKILPCECQDPQPKHVWTKLLPTDSWGILEDIRSVAGSSNRGVRKEIAVSHTAAITHPTGSLTREIIISEKTLISQFNPTYRAANVRRRRGAGHVILMIIAIPVCIIAFLVMAAILIPVGIVLGAFTGAAKGMQVAAEVTAKLSGLIAGD